MKNLCKTFFKNIDFQALPKENILPALNKPLETHHHNEAMH